jgi:hypothetical protein
LVPPAVQKLPAPFWIPEEEHACTIEYSSKLEDSLMAIEVSPESLLC